MGAFDLNAATGGLLAGIPGAIAGAVGPSNILNDVGNAGSNILNGVGNAVFGNRPTYSAPDMDPGSEKVVADNENGLLKDPQYYQDQITKGTEAAGQINDQGANQNKEQNELGGGGISGMSSAIANKAQKNFATKQSQLSENAKFQGAQMANNNLNMAAANAMALANAQRGVDSSLNSLNLQANAARYGTISSLMSGAGSIAGSYMGSQSSNSPLTASQYATQYGQQDLGPGQTETVYNPTQSSYGNYGSSAITPANESMGNYGMGE